MLRKVFSAAGIIAAPVVYLVGRMVRNPALSAWSIACDPHYKRGYDSWIQKNGMNNEAFARFSQAAAFCALAKNEIGNDLYELLPKAHGQLLQDIACLLIHHMKKNGYFVEVGVGDGMKYSNTLLLERDFGWKGILAEPATMFHTSIKNSRSAILDQRAVNAVNGEKLIFEQDDSLGELSGLGGQRTPRGNQVISAYEVETVRLDDLLNEYNAPDQIDYISIDTEGSEVSVLKGFSFEKRRVGFFTVEHNFDFKRLEAYSKILEPHGYRRILPELSGFDAWYIHQDMKDSCFR